MPSPITRFTRQNLEQCVSPAGDGVHYYVFVAMFFGHKCGPLVMLVGSRARRNRNLSLVLLTLPGTKEREGLS